MAMTFPGSNTPAQASNVGNDSSVPGANSAEALNFLYQKQTVTDKAFGDSPYTPSLGDGLIRVDTSGGGVTIALPAVAGVIGMRIEICKSDSSVNIVTIDPSGSETIGGDLTATISHTGDCLTIVAHSTGWIISQVLDTFRAVFFSIEPDANLGDHRVQNITGSGSHRFEFQIPADFLALEKLILILSPTAGAAGSGKDIDISSDYATFGEAFNFHSESDTTSVYDFTGETDQIVEFDITGIFTSIGPRDICGIFVDHKTIGGSIRYFGIELEYMAQG